MPPTGPPDKYTALNTATLTNSQIATQLGSLYTQGYTGPIASKLESDGSTTFFIGGYTAP